MADERDGLKRILRIDGLKAVLVKTIPARLVVSAVGTTSSPGWRQPTLVLQSVVDNGRTLILEFVALAPSNVVTWALMPTSADLVYEADPTSVSAVKARAVSNEIDVPVTIIEADAASAMHIMGGGGGDSPTPFSIGLDMTLRLQGGGGDDDPTPF